MHIFHRFLEMKALKHLIFGKFAYKFTLVLEESTLHTPNIR